MTGISEIYDAIDEIAGRLKAIKLEQTDLCEQLHREDIKEEKEIELDILDDALYHIRKARASVEELI